MSNKTIQKAVRMTPELWQEIADCMETAGLPDFSAFIHMAIRSQLNFFVDTQAIKSGDLQIMARKWLDMMELAKNTK
jgi:L-rhamnose mutarotase